MDGLLPYGGSSITRLTALINKDNSSQIRYGIDFTFTLPESNTQKPGKDTKIFVLPKPSKLYYDKPIPIYYKRLTLTALDRLPEGMVNPVFIPSVPFTIHDILPQINEALGIDLLAKEVVNAEHVEVLPRYPLRIVEGMSVAWIDSDYEFPAVHDRTEIPLSSIITTTVMSGLTYLPS